MSDPTNGGTIEPTAGGDGEKGLDAGDIAPPTVRRTVAHAFVAWEVIPTKPGEPFKQFRIMRGETYDFPREIVERFEPYGAFLPEEATGTEPPVFGTLSPLSTNPTDEEVKSFVRSATALELTAFLRDRPELGQAISSALQALTLATPPRPEGQTTVDGASTNDGTKANPTVGTSQEVSEPNGPSGAPDNLAANQQAAADNADLTPDPNYTDPGVEDAGVVVQGTAQEVVNYLSDHPDQAQAILDAENTRTAGTPRQAVVRAAQAAAAHAG